MAKASDQIVEKGARIAAWLLECAPARHRVLGAAASASSGTDRSVGLFEVAAAALARRDAPEDLRGPLDGASRRDREHRRPSPTAAHVCEVEVDPETGVVEIVRYTSVDDVGRAVNPLIVARPDPRRHRAGRGPGALGALPLRRRRPASCCRRSFMDYAMPRADMLPVVHDRDQRGAVDDAPARPARRRRGRHDAGARRRGATRSWTRSPTWAWSTSRCRRRPSASGTRSGPLSAAGTASQSCSGGTRAST